MRGLVVLTWLLKLKALQADFNDYLFIYQRDASNREKLTVVKAFFK